MADKITIRPVRAADIDRITDIENACFGVDRFTRRQLRYLALRAQGAFFVAETEGNIAGYVSLLAHRSRSALRIYAIAVDPPFRGMTIAGMLIEKAADYASAHGLSAVTLEVRTDNAAAIALYRKHGFSVSGIKKGYYQDGADAYAMARPLESPA